jgi:hypothetical protein
MRNVFSTALGMLILASLLGPIATAKGGASPDDLRPRERMQLGDELWQARPILKQCPEWSSDPNRACRFLFTEVQRLTAALEEIA